MTIKKGEEAAAADFFESLSRAAMGCPPGVNTVPKLLKDLQLEYAAWCNQLEQTCPSREEEYEQKTEWWLVKAREFAWRIAELEEKLAAYEKEQSPQDQKVPQNPRPE